MNIEAQAKVAQLLARLGPAEAGWRLRFDLWPQAEAQRWHAVLASAASGRMVLLADRDAEPLLLMRLEAQLRHPLDWHACTSQAIEAALEVGAAEFRALQGLDGLASSTSLPDAAQELSALHLQEQLSPVVRLLDATLYDALQDGVSDVHFESQPRGMCIRYRIDGVMQQVQQIEGQVMAEQLVSRLKVMSELDIGERRLPQDGRFKLRMQGREIDFRLSVMPSVHGEDAVVRVLDRAQVQSQGQLSLAGLGFTPEFQGAIRALVSQPYGMLLVTGPTGSGKTTTLYAAINEVHTGRDKIITIEDPVEYQLPGVVQIPVNERKGLTFAKGLRSVLRHDPDRVMVGEIRDTETAQIAVQAALTGHLVFSTVHANNAFDVLGRFMHMGLDLYHVVSALNGVLAQRLMRINCTHCARPVRVSSAQLARLGLPSDEGWSAYAEGAGCEHCRGTGYRGRQAVSELLCMDDGLRDLIASKAPMLHIKEAARRKGMRSLREAAVDMVRRGASTLEELERVTLAD